jgi:putative tryptophan/tyrosine transport system substrate-binding protein
MTMEYHTIGYIATFTLSLLAAPLAAVAQPAGKMPRIGVLATASAVGDSSALDAFRQGLRDLGYVEGQHLAIEARTVTPDQFERLPDLAAELVRRGVDLLFAAGPEAPLRAAREVASTIPIVMVAVDYDPIALGYIASLARPGGHITGVVFQQVELTGKRLELLKEAVPTVSRVAVFWDAHSADQLPVAEAAARSLGVALQPVELRHPPYDFDQAFHEATREQAGALLVLMSPAFAFPERARLPDLAVRHQLPTMFGNAQYTRVGGLMAYGVRLTDMYSRAATYVDKILKGAKPADLPVEQPTKFEFSLNLKTATRLGMTIPSSLLVLANEVIR